MVEGAVLPRPAGAGRVTVEVPRWLAALSDRGVQAIVVLVAAAAGGFVALGLGWAGVAARLYVGLQLPFLVSGAFGGVAVAGCFLAIAGVQLERRQNAAERFDLDQAVRDVAALGELLPSLLARSVPSGLVVNRRTVHRADCRMAVGKGLPAWSGGSGDFKACRVCRPELPL